MSEEHNNEAFDNQLDFLLNKEILTQSEYEKLDNWLADSENREIISRTVVFGDNSFDIYVRILNDGECPDDMNTVIFVVEGHK